MAEAMTPWERHAAGAGMKRFSYSGVAELQKESHSGFLVTCPFRREKSATTEAMNILTKHIGACSIEDDHSGETKAEGSANDSETAPRKVFSLIKLTGSGLVFISTSSDVDPVSIACKVLEDLKTGAEKPPSWCNRLLPLQATCPAEKEAVFSTVLRLAMEDTNHLLPKSGFKYAAAYTKRDGGDGNMTLERKDCFEAVGSAMLKISESASVDLSKPEVVVFVEVLPIMGLKETPLCGVSIVPHDIVATKPKLTVRPLIRDEDGSKKMKN